MYRHTSSSTSFSSVQAAHRTCLISVSPQHVQCAKAPRADVIKTRKTSHSAMPMLLCHRAKQASATESGTLLHVQCLLPIYRSHHATSRCGCSNGPSLLLCTRHLQVVMQDDAFVPDPVCGVHMWSTQACEQQQCSQHSRQHVRFKKAMPMPRCRHDAHILSLQQKVSQGSSQEVLRARVFATAPLPAGLRAALQA